MTEPILIDFFCGAGGVAQGYSQVGFRVIGVDNKPQPNYPFEFIQGDAFDPEILKRLFRKASCAHASPPCQGYSRGTPMRSQKEAPKLIPKVRKLLKRSGLPYVIENVMSAPLKHPIKLCGSMFDLPVERHRLFECSFKVEQPYCQHRRQVELWPEGFYTRDRVGRVVKPFGGGRVAGDLELWKWAMEVPWMRTRVEVREAIPPPYTEYIGKFLIGEV